MSIEQLLDKLAQDRFFGSLEVKFEAGTITLVRKTETLKVANHRELPHRENRGATNEISKS